MIEMKEKIETLHVAKLEMKQEIETLKVKAKEADNGEARVFCDNGNMNELTIICTDFRAKASMTPVW